MSRYMGCVFLACSGFAQTVVHIDPKSPQQSFEGWGTSLCWMAEDLGGWPEADYDRAVDQLTDTVSGLGYNLFRYNIGGGDQPSHHHLSADRAVPGYKPAETGGYDWSADAYQRNILARIVATGRPAVFEAFSNSPPWWMTKSGCASGNTDGSDNLKPEYFGAFADYLTEVTKHFRDNWGVTFRTLEPFNEPTARWWKANGGQEGCGFKDNQASMIKALAHALQSKGLTGTSISAADENSISQAVSGFKNFDDSARALVAQMNTHSYSGLNERAAYAAFGAQYHKRIWESETGPLSWPGGNQMDVSLWLSEIIVGDIKQMKANAWVEWQAAAGGQGGGVWRDFDTQNQTLIPNKRFYALAQFSRFIRPGASIINNDRDSVLAALVSSTGNLVVVIVNGTTSNRNYSLDLTGFSSLPATAAFYRTSETENLAGQPALPIAAGKLAVTAASRSINTYLVKMAAPTAVISWSKIAEKNRPLVEFHDGILEVGRGGEFFRLSGKRLAPGSVFPTR